MTTILVINPGATSTKYAVFRDNEAVLDQTVPHAATDLEIYPTVIAQEQYRLDLILQGLTDACIDLASLDVVVGRGGLLKPITGGVYSVNDTMVEELRQGKRLDHASNLGAILADRIGKQLAIPAFIVDPVSVDEMDPVARISGLPELPRVSFVHALNSKAVARKVAQRIGKRYEEMNLVVAHLGTGISITPHRKGRMVDVNNASEEGPFSPDRCGGLPARSLIRLCFSGKYTEAELLKKIVGSGGMYAYLGTKDLRNAEKMADEGDGQASLILAAMAYQIVKEIGAMAAVLAGSVDRIVITGGMAHSQRLVKAIADKVAFIAPIEVIPGEEEMEALAAGALRVLAGEESVLEY